jgi:hypothetical protein
LAIILSLIGQTGLDIAYDILKVSIPLPSSLSPLSFFLFYFCIYFKQVTIKTNYKSTEKRKTWQKLLKYINKELKLDKKQRKDTVERPSTPEGDTV